MGLETSKAVHQMTICEAGKSKITSIGWAQNLAGKRQDPTVASSIRTWEQLASQGLDISKKKRAADLPRELTFLEIETALPKLSPLPASGGSGSVYARSSGCNSWTNTSLGTICSYSQQDHL
jgi:anaphase-promoting complex subunit 4